MRKQVLYFTLLMLLGGLPSLAWSACDHQGIWLQVLGSGGPELDDGRASSGYLIWQQGRARILVDMGTGSLLRFEQSKASLNDLDVILMSHFHVDHSNDLPALIKASYFSDRQHDLELYGPTGNQRMPSATDFVHRLFSQGGAFQYLSSYLDGSDSYRLLPHNVIASGRTLQRVSRTTSYQLSAVPVHHGPIPSLAWRVDIQGHSIVFSGDMNNQNRTLVELANGADILVAHHAIPEDAGRIARNLHMTPSTIGQIAASAGVKQLVLSHRMNRTLGHEQLSVALIRQHYHGPIVFADDLQCFQL